MHKWAELEAPLLNHCMFNIPSHTMNANSGIQFRNLSTFKDYHKYSDKAGYFFFYNTQPQFSWTGLAWQPNIQTTLFSHIVSLTQRLACLAGSFLYMGLRMLYKGSGILFSESRISYTRYRQHSEYCPRRVLFKTKQTLIITMRTSNSQSMKLINSF